MPTRKSLRKLLLAKLLGFMQAYYDLFRAEECTVHRMHCEGSLICGREGDEAKAPRLARLVAHDTCAHDLSVLHELLVKRF